MSKLFGTADYDSGARMAQGQTATGVKEAKEYTQQALGQIAPYQKVGTEALDMYRDIVLGGDMSKFYTSPSYQFRLGEGVKALEQGASARGDLLSGAQQKALLGYGQDLASQEYQNYLSNVGGLATQGYGAGQVAGGYLQGTGQNILGAYSNLGQIQADLMAKKAQAKSGLVGDLLSGGALIGGAYLGGLGKKVGSTITNTIALPQVPSSQMNLPF